MDKFSDIRPYSDEETVAALDRVSRHAMLPVISKYLFPDKSPFFLPKMLRNVTGVDDFQFKVMAGVVSAILAKTSEGFTYSGIDNLRKLKGKRFLAVSNHRDIVLDPALIQYTLMSEGFPFTEICVGNNLLANKLIEDLMRSNRMIKVIRGIGARELYLSSQLLSKYIRQSVTSQNASVWIAQREGRTKNGLDSTEQGLLKMFDMSGTGSFEENFKELNIIPISISYEYEPCDARKARELYIRRKTGSYVKKKNEDTHSILTGIRQQKGHIHLAIGEPLTEEEISQASGLKCNDRYQAIRHKLDIRINNGYRLWKTNYMGYDLMNGTDSFLGKKYLPDDLRLFKEYTEHKLSKMEKKLNRDEIRRIFWEIYGNPVTAVRND